jgi:hypothetical protein
MVEQEVLRIEVLSVLVGRHQEAQQTLLAVTVLLEQLQVEMVAMELMEEPEAQGLQMQTEAPETHPAEAEAEVKEVVEIAPVVPVHPGK